MTRVRIASGHAVQRYQERVRPALDLAAARRELEALIPFGVLSLVPPTWKGSEHEDCDAWLMLGPDVALPVKQGIATTCMFRVQSPETIAVRRKRRRLQRLRNTETTPDARLRELRDAALSDEATALEATE